MEFDDSVLSLASLLNLIYFACYQKDVVTRETNILFSVKSAVAKYCSAFQDTSGRLSRLLSSLQVPLKDLSEDALALLLDHITVAGNDALKVPLVNSSHALVECRSVGRTQSVPDKSLLPDSRASRGVDLAHQLGENTSRGTGISTRVLLCSRQIEQQVGLNQCLGRLVVEDQLLVCMCVYVFGIELAVEGLVDVPAGVVLWAEQMCPGQWLFLTLALGFQLIRTNEFGVWEGLVPVVHEDVVFGIVGCDVFDGSEFVDATTDFVGESYGGEDGYAAILQAY